MNGNHASDHQKRLRVFRIQASEPTRGKIATRSRGWSASCSTSWYSFRSHGARSCSCISALGKPLLAEPTTAVVRAGDRSISKPSLAPAIKDYSVHLLVQAPCQAMSANTARQEPSRPGSEEPCVFSRIRMREMPQSCRAGKPVRGCLNVAGLCAVQDQFMRLRGDAGG